MCERLYVKHRFLCISIKINFLYTIPKKRFKYQVPLIPVHSEPSFHMRFYVQCQRHHLITSEAGTHSCFRNVFSKFISHTVQKPQNNTSYIPNAMISLANCTNAVSTLASFTFENVFHICKNVTWHVLPHTSRVTDLLTNLTMRYLHTSTLIKYITNNSHIQITAQPNNPLSVTTYKAQLHYADSKQT